METTSRQTVSGFQNTPALHYELKLTVLLVSTFSIWRIFVLTFSETICYMLLFS